MIAIIADDAPVMRDQAVAIMRRFDVTVAAQFPDGAPAIAYLALHPEVDLAVLDIVMLGTTGLDVAKWIKTNGHKAKVILVTSMGQDGAARSIDNNADAVLIKPYHPDQLIAKIVEVTDGEQS